MRKHPHGCGEDGRLRFGAVGLTETPPRVWGRLAARERVGMKPGNTPTGVGKTDLFVDTIEATWKHPHGCGEDGTIRRPA